MMLRRFSSAAWAAVLALVVAEAPGSAASGSGAMAIVRQFLDAFNRDDVAAMAATCAPQTAILDDFPPHTWQSCAAWAKSLGTFDKASGNTWGTVTIGAPWHDDVTGNVAYVVVPASFAYKSRGKPVNETGAVWTLALEKTAAGWRITAWAWGGH
jgi:ketosteroid isomerase-like protein